MHPFALRHQFLPSNKMQQNTVADTDGLLFVFQNNLLLVEKKGNDLNIPKSRLEELLPGKISFSRFMGSYQNIPCHLVELENDFTPSHTHTWKNLRDTYPHLDHDLYLLASKAIQLIHWNSETRFCGQCGSPTNEHPTEYAKTCPACDFVAYPRLSPVVIMTIEHQDEILLGRAPHFPKGMYSPLAGFVEAGETLEEAVAREVKEEAGIAVNNIRYVTSQSWSFPHSMMLGFRSDYVSGEIVIEQEELEDVQWFHKNSLPVLPSPISISRYLIDCYLNSTR